VWQHVVIALLTYFTLLIYCGLYAQCLVGVVPGESHAAGPRPGERADGTGGASTPTTRVYVYTLVSRETDASASAEDVAA